MRHAAVVALVLAGFGLVAMATRPAPRRGPGKEYQVRVRAYAWRLQAAGAWGLLDGDVNVPDDRDVRLFLEAGDDRPLRLLIPDAGVRAIAWPGRRTEVVFRPPPIGEYPIYGVRSRLIVRPWADMGPGPGCCLVAEQTTLAYGEHLFRSYSCFTCHAAEGPTSLRGVFLGPRRGADGGLARVDLEYLRRSLSHPQEESPPPERAAAYLGAGMPPYALRPPDIDALLTYVAWLTPPEACGPECPRDAWPDPKAPADPCRMQPPSRKASLLGPDPKRPRGSGQVKPLSRPRR